MDYSTSKSWLESVNNVTHSGVQDFTTNNFSAFEQSSERVPGIAAGSFTSNYGIPNLTRSDYTTSGYGRLNVSEGTLVLSENLTANSSLFDTSLGLPPVLESDLGGVIFFHAMMEAAQETASVMDAGLHNASYNGSLAWFNASLNDEDNGTAPYTHFYEMARFVTGLICYPIICFYGLVGNVLIMIVFAQKSMSTSTNVYLSALAVSDIIKILNDLLYFLTILLMHTDPVAGNKCFGYLYPYAHFFFNMSVCVSSWLTVSVAVERYILVCHPARSKSLITIPRAKIISVMCYIIMTVVAIPSALRYETIEKTILRNGTNITELDVNLTRLWQENKFLMNSYNWLQSLLRSIIPLFILALMNAFIINALRKTRANKRNASRNKITIMLIVVIIFFLICIIPDAVMSAFFNLGYAEVTDNLVRGVREITDMLLAVNAAINFTLYMVFNKIFRDQFVALFCARCYKPEAEKTEYKRLADSKPANAQTNGIHKGRKTQQSEL